MTNQDRPKTPVRVYQTDNHIMLAAPMPGSEPKDISVKIVGDRVTIQSEKRGPDYEWRELLVSEWNVGPYYREISLPMSVSGTLSNATYGNGVLILSMPKVKAGQKGEPVEFALEVIQAPRGERVGHTGRDIHKITTQEYRQLREQTTRRAVRKNGSARAGISSLPKKGGT